MAREEVLKGLDSVLIFLTTWKKYFGQRKNLLEDVLNFRISLIHAKKWALSSALTFDNFVWWEYQEMLQSGSLLKT